MSVEPENKQPPVVLVAPAMAIGSGYYRPLVEEIRSRGWTAAAMGRRGFERSGIRASRRNNWSYLDEIDDIATAVAAARRRHPGRPVLILGHSLGGQLAAGHELTRSPADALVTVGGCLPHFRDYAYGGAHIAAMGGIVVPVATAVFGYLPRPAFGGPGARTLMREWGRMAVTGVPPYPTEGLIRTPSLLISLAGDRLAPRKAVDTFGRRLFDAQHVTRWHYDPDDAPSPASVDHIAWVRTPAPVVDRIVDWWASRVRSAAATT